MRKRFLQTHPFNTFYPSAIPHFSHRILTRTPHRSIKPLCLLLSVKHCCIHVIYTSLPNFCLQPLLQQSLNPALKPNLKLMIAVCPTLSWQARLLLNIQHFHWNWNSLPHCSPPITHYNLTISAVLILVQLLQPWRIAVPLLVDTPFCWMIFRFIYSSFTAALVQWQHISVSSNEDMYYVARFSINLSGCQYQNRYSHYYPTSNSP